LSISELGAPEYEQDSLTRGTLRTRPSPILILIYLPLDTIWQIICVLQLDIKVKVSEFLENYQGWIVGKLGVEILHDISHLGCQLIVKVNLDVDPVNHVRLWYLWLLRIALSNLSPFLISSM
jgi:hypothetical protein